MAQFKILLYYSCFNNSSSFYKWNRQKKHTLKSRELRKWSRGSERDGWEALLQGCAPIHSNGCNRVHKRWCQCSIQSSYSKGVELLCLHCLFICCLHSCSPFASPLLYQMVISFYIFISNWTILLYECIFHFFSTHNLNMHIYEGQEGFLLWTCL